MAGKSRKQMIEEMLAEQPDDPELRYALAMEYVSAGDHAAAVGHFQQLLTASPDYVPAYLQAGQALIRLGRAAEAREVLGRCIGAARAQGDLHAAEEMQGFLASLGS